MRKTIAKASHNQDIIIAAALLTTLGFASADACAQKTEEEIALAAQNPVAAMVSLPLQYNYDQNIGPWEDGHKNYVNVQPVIIRENPRLCRGDSKSLTCAAVGNAAPFPAVEIGPIRRERQRSSIIGNTRRLRVTPPSQPVLTDCD